MKRVLLAGASHLIGSHILNQALSAGLRVRAIVESQEEAWGIQELFSRLDSSVLDFLVVPSGDITHPGVFQDAFNSSTEPFEAVILCLAADGYQEVDCLSRYISAESRRLCKILGNIKEASTAVIRVILVSSLIRFAKWVLNPSAPQNPRTDTYNSPEVRDVASDYIHEASQASDNIIYDAITGWMKDSKTSFDVVLLSAPAVYGPSIRNLENWANIEEGNRWIWATVKEHAMTRTHTHPHGMDSYVDVRDLAFAAIQALHAPITRVNRFPISAGALPPSSTILHTLATRFPELRDNGDSDKLASQLTPTETAESGDSSQSASVLGLTRYRMWEETLSDVTVQLLELRRRLDGNIVAQSRIS